MDRGEMVALSRKNSLEVVRRNAAECDAWVKVAQQSFYNEWLMRLRAANT